MLLIKQIQEDQLPPWNLLDPNESMKQVDLIKPMPTNPKPSEWIRKRSFQRGQNKVHLY